MAKKKTKAVGKAAKTPTVKQLRAEISSDVSRERSLKHDAGTAKTSASRKHDLARAAAIGTKVVSLKHQLAADLAPSKRGWSPDEDVACCSARAVAESLRLALGVRVADDDVLALHWAAGGDRDGGTSILDVFRAAQEIVPGFPVCSPWPADRRIDGGGFGEFASASHCGVTPSPGDLSVILGLDLPGGKPHAVTYDLRDGTWWSWGEPYSPADFPGAVIEEAWAVTWS